ncbi:unnamed protein product, partial [Clonostachys rosea f. rosea IK726]
MKDKRFQMARNSDSMFNSLELPRMGCTGIRLGRNFPREHCQKPTDEQLWSPNPRLVSEKFMARKDGGFIPATTLNLLAAAWIQFQTYDWFNHELDLEDQPYYIPLPPGHSWQGKITLPKTKLDNILDPSDVKCSGYKNINSASTEEATHELRGLDPDGKLELAENSTGAFIPRDKDSNPRTGFNDNWWVSMEILHTLFALEHNILCNIFRKVYPNWTGDQIFNIARLVNYALIAKIHTWGLTGERLTKIVGRISKRSEIISGIPGSGVYHDGIPFSLTEEFVSVYRIHSLIPDNIAFFEAKHGKYQTITPLEDLTFKNAQKPLESGISFADLFYSFGINYPGAITNNNYPNFLRDLHTPDGLYRDIGTVDIVCNRERGIPRYCAFRRILRMKAPKTFEELTGGNKELAKQLSEVYNGDIELVDTLVGSHSEPLIPGFGFSETAFHIFIVMNTETYTKEGFHWVQYTTIKDILIRYFPELEDTLKNSKNTFTPWAIKSESKNYQGIETNAKKT